MSIEQTTQKILDNQISIRLDIAAIKVDLQHHIKRSDHHEKLINKLWFSVAMLAGAGVANVGPSILKYIGSAL